jgi:hypothetical protein
MPNLTRSRSRLRPLCTCPTPCRLAISTLSVLKASRPSVSLGGMPAPTGSLLRSCPATERQGSSRGYWRRVASPYETAADEWPHRRTGRCKDPTRHSVSKILCLQPSRGLRLTIVDQSLGGHQAGRKYRTDGSPSSAAAPNRLSSAIQASAAVTVANPSIVCRAPLSEMIETSNPAPFRLRSML